jgi:hypothetical protein
MNQSSSRFAIVCHTRHRFCLALEHSSASAGGLGRRPPHRTVKCRDGLLRDWNAGEPCASAPTVPVVMGAPDVGTVVSRSARGSPRPACPVSRHTGQRHGLPEGKPPWVIWVVCSCFYSWPRFHWPTPRRYAPGIRSASSNGTSTSRRIPPRRYACVAALGQWLTGHGPDHQCRHRVD